MRTDTEKNPAKLLETTNPVSLSDSQIQDSGNSLRMVGGEKEDGEGSKAPGKASPLFMAESDAIIAGRAIAL